MEKLNPEALAEWSHEGHGDRENVQYGVTTPMVAAYLEEEHHMPRPVALAVADHLWDVWHDMVDGQNVTHRDLVNSVILGWVNEA